ncbi:MAG TPA: DNA translocase FtsK, partial [Bacillota bacterium]|nr:DNA translocase FtsK [Bacillota bacterium]
ALLLPFYLLNIAFFYRRTRENGSLRSRCVASLLNLLFFSMLLHIFVTKAPSTTIQELFTSEAFKSIYYNGTELGSGGVIGGYLCELLMLGMGYVGAMIVCWVFMLLSGVFVFGKTPGEMFEAICEYSRARKAKRKEMLLIEQYEREQKEKERQKEEAQRIKEEKKTVKDKPFELPPLPVGISAQADVRPEAEEAAEDSSDIVRPQQIRTIPELAQTGETLPPDSDEIIPLDIAAQPGKQDSKPEEDRPVAEQQLAAQQESEEETPSGADTHPYIFPPISLLQPNDVHGSGMTQSQIVATSEKLVRVLESFKVRTTVINVSIGPAVTRYELQPAEGVKTKAIANLADDIALHLAARSVRIESPIPGKSAVGIELPNEKVSLVRLRDLIETKQFRDSPCPLFSCL